MPSGKARVFGTCILGSNPSAPAKYEKLLDKIFFRSNNLSTISQNIKALSNNTPVHKIFKTIKNYSSDSD